MIRQKNGLKMAKILLLFVACLVATVFLTVGVSINQASADDETNALPVSKISNWYYQANPSYLFAKNLGYSNDDYASGWFTCNTAAGVNYVKNGGYVDWGKDGVGCDAFRYTKPIKEGETVSINNAVTLKMRDAATNTKGEKVDVKIVLDVEIYAWGDSYKNDTTNILEWIGDPQHPETTTIEMPQSRRNGKADGADYDGWNKTSTKSYYTLTFYDSKDHTFSVPYNVEKMSVEFDDIDIYSDTEWCEQVVLLNGFTGAQLDTNTGITYADQYVSRYGVIGTKFYPTEDLDSKPAYMSRVYGTVNNSKESANNLLRFMYTGAWCGGELYLRSYGYPGDDIQPPKKFTGQYQHAPCDSVTYNIIQDFPYTDGTANTNAKSIVLEDEFDDVFDLTNIKDSYSVTKYDKATKTTIDLTSKWELAVKNQKVTFTCKDTSTAMGELTFTVTPKVKTREQLDALKYTYGTDIINKATTRINDVAEAPAEKRIVLESNEVKIRIDAPNLETEKTTSKSTVQKGDTFDYVINTKVNDADAKNIVITDPIPKEFEVYPSVETIKIEPYGTVTVDKDNNLTVKVGSATKGSTIKVTIPVKVVGDTVGTVKNTTKSNCDNAYEVSDDVDITIKPQDAGYVLPISKTTKSDVTIPSGDIQWNFELTPGSGSPAPSRKTATITTNGAQSAKIPIVEEAFGAIPFTQAGTYMYTVKEVTTSLPTGWTCAQASYDVYVKVEASGSQLVVGGLYKDSECKDRYDSNTVAFTNTYTPTSAKATINGTKKFAEQVPPLIKDGDYKVKVEGTTKEGVTDINGTYDVKTDLTWTTPEAKLSKAGTYSYTVTEVNTKKSGVEYDRAVYYVDFIVKDTGGQFSVEKVIKLGQEKVDAITFINTYLPGRAVLPLQVTKKIDSKIGTIPAGKIFRFVATIKDPSGVEQSLGSTYITTSQDVDSYIVDFGNVKFTTPGVYEINFKETLERKPGEPITPEDGWEYDLTNKTIKATVTDNGSGDLSVTTDPEQTTDISINNVYNPKAVTGKIDGKKLWLDQVPPYIEEGDYKVSVESDGTPGASKIDGEYDIDTDFRWTTPEIIFTQPGQYTYFVKEVDTQKPSVKYDETVYSVIFFVTDNNGKLEAEKVTIKDEALADSITFENEYVPTPVTDAIAGIKVWADDKQPTDIAEKDYQVEIAKVKFDPENGANDISGIVNVKEDLTWQSKKIEFTRAGTYTFEVKEKNTGKENVDYDETKYNVKYTIIDNEGKLEKSKIITVDFDTVDKISFENTYTEMKPLPDFDNTPTSSSGQSTVQKVSSAVTSALSKTGDNIGFVIVGTLFLVVAVSGTVLFARRFFGKK